MIKQILTLAFNKKTTLLATSGWDRPTVIYDIK